MNCLVSIIIPTYNRSFLIKETLNSVLSQTYTNWECIIVDDGSIDNTNEIVNEYLKNDNRFQFYNRPSNRIKGANACRNHGFENSKGDYVMFLDSDDILNSYCLGERIEIMLNNPMIDLLIRDASLLKDEGKQSKTINKDPDFFTPENYLRMFLRYEIPWQTMCVLYKKAILQKCQFDENLKRFQDVSFNVKVLSQVTSLQIKRDFKIDSYYRVDETKVVKNNFVGNMLETLIVFYQIHSNLFNNANYKGDVRKFSCKIFLEFVIPYFNSHKKESNKLFNWSLRSNLYSFKQKNALFVMMLLLNSKIFHIKGVGMNSYRTYFKNVINK